MQFAGHGCVIHTTNRSCRVLGFIFPRVSLDKTPAGRALEKRVFLRAGPLKDTRTGCSISMVTLPSLCLKHERISHCVYCNYIVVPWRQTHKGLGVPSDWAPLLGVTLCLAHTKPPALYPWETALAFLPQHCVS